MHRVSAQMYLRATVQDVYAVYKMRVISQNSRRKAIADTATNWFQIEFFISRNIQAHKIKSIPSFPLYLRLGQVCGQKYIPPL